MNIRFLKNNDINTYKWDKCISKSINANASVFSWYLDIVNPTWGALVMDDYLAVMPLPIRESYGIKFLQNPPFSEEYTIYAKIPPDKNLQLKFTEKLISRFKYINIKLDIPKFEHQNFKYKTQYFLELDLIHPYKSLKSKFSKNLSEQIKQSDNACHFINDILPNNIINAVLSSYPNYNTRKLDILRMLISNLMRKGAAHIIGAYNKHNELVGIICFAVTHAKARLFFTWEHPDFKNIYPLTGLINFYIKSNNETNLTVQFPTADNSEDSKLFSEFSNSQFTFYQIKNKKYAFMWSVLKRK